MLKTLERYPGAWSPEHANDWYRSRPRPFGVNYVPSYACNTSEIWMPETFNLDTIRRELKWVADAGFNCVRVFLQYHEWKRQHYSFLDRFEIFVNLASACGLTVIPVLFDDCNFAGMEPCIGWQPEPRPGVHNSCWTASPGAAVADDLTQYEALRAYVCAVMEAWRDDKRILFWDMYNEPGNSNRGSRSLYLLKKSFDWARSMQPKQPLTVGYWCGEAKDSPIGLQFCEQIALNLSDVLTFHHYGDAPSLNGLIESLQTYGYPLICTEWFARPVNSVYSTHLPLFGEKDVGCVQWGFVNGRTQTNIPPGWDPEMGEFPVWFHDNVYSDGSWYSFPEKAQISEYAKTCTR